MYGCHNHVRILHPHIDRTSEGWREDLVGVTFSVSTEFSRDRLDWL